MSLQQLEINQLVTKVKPTCDYVHMAMMGRLMKYHEEQKKRNTDENIHVSDTLYCKRQTVFRRLDPHPGLEDTEMFYYLRGEAIHKALQECFTIYSPIRFLIEQHYTYRDFITCTPDAIDVVENQIVEIKTTNTTKLSKPWSSNLDQLGIYMAVTGINKGTILYMLLLNPPHPFIQFQYEMTEDARKLILDILYQNSLEIKEGIRKKDPLGVEGVWGSYNKGWKCERDGVPMCKYYDICRAHEVINKGI